VANFLSFVGRPAQGEFFGFPIPVEMGHPARSRMSLQFEELDFRSTPLGDVSLRRRRIPSLGDIDVFEVKLGEDFLMSSLFTVVEVALADLGLAGLGDGPLDVVVGGLGLGHTADAALKNPMVRSLIVVDALDAVIDWHRRGLVPLGPVLTADPRCRFVNGDFFALADNPEEGFDPESPRRRFDAVLLDIDHSPRNLLNPQNASFYSQRGLRHLAAHLKPGGRFAMWSDDPPDADFQELLGGVFTTTETHLVSFDNPLQDRKSASTVYVCGL
jgi:SAM-dependent methyltransferase